MRLVKQLFRQAKRIFAADTGTTTVECAMLVLLAFLAVLMVIVAVGRQTATLY